MKFEFRNVVLWLLAINVTAFALQQFVPGFTDLFILDSDDALSRPWMYLTAMFLHGGANHILFNMLTLFFLGPLLESNIGAKRFLVVYLGSGMLANVLSSFFYPRALGASGAIMGVIGVLIILMPTLIILIWGIVPTPLWMLGILYAVMDVFGVIFPSGVGNIAHLIGMGFGLLYGLYLKKQGRKFQRKFSSKKHLNEIDMDEYLKSGRI